ncbi:carotenoid ester lipase precursor, partial [Moniliophthora roreri]
MFSLIVGPGVQASPVSNALNRIPFIVIGRGLGLEENNPPLVPISSFTSDRLHARRDLPHFDFSSVYETATLMNRSKVTSSRCQVHQPMLELSEYQ